MLADEQQARCWLAFMNNFEGRHQVIDALDIVERACVDDQWTTVGREAIPHP